MEPLALEMSRAEARSLWSRDTLGLPQSLWTRLWSRGPGVGLHPSPSTWVEDPPSEEAGLA